MDAPSPTTILDRLLKADDDKNQAVLADSSCPACGKPAIKSGSRNTRRGKVQRLYCRRCDRSFCASHIPRRQYSAPIILETVTAYNLGRTIADTQGHISRRFRATVAHSTIHSWLGHFASLSTFSKFRKRYTFEEETTIQTRTFSHKQEYKFKFHRLKANILCKRMFPAIRRYL